MRADTHDHRERRNLAAGASWSRALALAAGLERLCGGARLFVCALVLAAAATGCGHEIGDSCATNIDCATDGTRICDLTQLGGYCTVRNCSADSCPGSSVCVNFFNAGMLAAVCDPATEDAVDPAVQATNACSADEICLTSGFCALPSQGQSYCMKHCKKDSDCRAGYRCLTTGVDGAEVVLDPTHPDQTVLRFCGEALDTTESS